LIIKSDNTLYSFGRGVGGVLGHGNEEIYPTPTKVEHFKFGQVKQISCSHSHAAICTTDGKLVITGKGSNGFFREVFSDHRYLYPALMSIENVFQISCSSRCIFTLTGWFLLFYS
jgi:alpha-tubulin suppressor-like RCC1 family protein